jgi:hypothetical protein
VFESNGHRWHGGNRVVHSHQSLDHVPLYSWPIQRLVWDFKDGNLPSLEEAQHNYDNYYFTKVLRCDVVDFALMRDLVAMKEPRLSSKYWPAHELPFRKQGHVWFSTEFGYFYETPGDPSAGVVMSVGLVSTVEPTDYGSGDVYVLGIRRNKTRTVSAATIRKQVTPKLRYTVLERDNHTCQSCGAKAPNTPLHIDHIIPVSAGGGNELDNLQTLCLLCNIGKGASF